VSGLGGLKIPFPFIVMCGGKALVLSYQVRLLLVLYFE
jgi:hypothetical protein